MPEAIQVFVNGKPLGGQRPAHPKD